MSFLRHEVNGLSSHTGYEGGVFAQNWPEESQEKPGFLDGIVKLLGGTLPDNLNLDVEERFVRDDTPKPHPLLDSFIDKILIWLKL